MPSECSGASALEKARLLLQDITPLENDCGALCGAVCCRSMDGEETGMLLFPGEEKLGLCEGFRVTETGNGRLLVCDGRCDRDLRPLACRMFPLLPLLRGDRVSVAMDERAKGVCPLYRRGVRGLDPRFTAAVRQAGQLLAGDGEQRAFLLRLTEEHDRLKELRISFGAV